MVEKYSQPKPQFVQPPLTHGLMQEQKPTKKKTMVTNIVSDSHNTKSTHRQITPKGRFTRFRVRPVDTSNRDFGHD